MKRFVTAAYARAKAILMEHKPSLQRIADELMVREVLDADQVKKLARGESLDEYVPAPPPAEDSHRQPAERPTIVPSMGKPIAQE